jgi:hypothetical protein
MAVNKEQNNHIAKNAEIRNQNDDRMTKTK